MRFLARYNRCPTAGRISEPTWPASKAPHPLLNHDAISGCTGRHPNAAVIRQHILTQELLALPAAFAGRQDVVDIKALLAPIDNLSQTAARPSRGAPSAATRRRPQQQDPKGTPLSLNVLNSNRQRTGQRLPVRTGSWYHYGNRDGYRCVDAGIPQKRGRFTTGLGRVVILSWSRGITDRIWQIARYDAAFLAYRVAAPRHSLNLSNPFSTK